LSWSKLRGSPPSDSSRNLERLPASKAGIGPVNATRIFHIIQRDVLANEPISKVTILQRISRRLNDLGPSATEILFTTRSVGRILTDACYPQTRRFWSKCRG